MSEFQRNLFQKKLKRAEAQLGLNMSESEENSADDLTPLPDFSRKKQSNKKSDQNPVKDQLEKVTYPKWDQYFDRNDVFETEEGFKFNTYTKMPFNQTQNPVIFVCHQGAGSSGLTFAELSKSLQSKFAEKNSRKINTEDHELPGLFAFDMRGHSQTGLLNKKETDFSMDQFCKDFVFVLTKFLQLHEFQQKSIKPSIFLVGHSLGGSILTNVIVKNYIQDQEVLGLIKGLTLLDIVEEAATASLHAMISYLDRTPRSFKTLEDCIQWHLDRKLVNNEISARISVPSYFRYDETDKNYKWIADLYSTRQFWDQWFVGLSSNFVSIGSRIAKLLILSGHDNLDKYLMIGQMQGKYQLVVFQDRVYVPETGKTQHCGHFVQEDCPDKAALTLIDYVERNDITRSDKQLNIKWGSMR